MAKTLQGGLTTTLDDEKSTIINLKYTDTSPERAERVLNTIIEVYNERWINEKNRWQETRQVSSMSVSW